MDPIRFIRLLEWRKRLKRFQKENRAVPLLIRMFGAAMLCRIVHVGWTLVEVELVDSSDNPLGVERNIIEIEEVIVAVTRNSQTFRDELAKSMPELAIRQLDPNGKDSPDDEGPDIIVIDDGLDDDLEGDL